MFEEVFQVDSYPPEFSYRLAPTIRAHAHIHTRVEHICLLIFGVIPPVFSLGVKIVILFRSDLFASNCRRRNKNSKPGPGVVFDIVNETIARKLGKEPLTFPSTADAMQAWLHACDEGLFLPEPSKAPEPSKLNLKRFRINRKTDEMSRLGDSF